MQNNEANINKEAFSFIDTIIEIHEKYKAPKLDKGSIAEIGVVDWSDKLIKDAPFFERKYIQSMSDFGIRFSSFYFHAGRRLASADFPASVLTKDHARAGNG